MKVLVPKLSGFCPGVKNAEKKILSQIKEKPNGNYSVFGMMINNKNYIKFLDSINVKTIYDINKAILGSVLFIRTHGIDINLQNKLQKQFELIDLTCKNVKRVQEKIKFYSDSDAAIFITGKKNHPEVIGLKSYAKYAVVFENEKEVNTFLKNPQINNINFNPQDYKQIFITSQTTGDKSFYKDCIKSFKQKWRTSIIEGYDSICPITEKKENEALQLQKYTDISFVIGDNLSSNANKLFNILKKNNSQTFFIQDVDELKTLNIDFLNKTTALVVSSASTPSFLEKKVINFLEKI